MRRRLVPAICLSACLALAGCGISPAPQRERGSQRIMQRQKMVLILGEEYRFVWDPEVVAHVNRIGTSVSRAIGVSDNSFHFYVIDRPTINAFTSPLGDIFIFSGLLNQMSNSSELAGVLAHEMGHVRANHFGEMQRRAAISSIPGLMAAVLSKGDPRVIASTIAAAQSYQLHWSREMEIESDRLALQYLRKTGYDSEGLLRALRLIEKSERMMPLEVPEGLLSHPATSSRIAFIEGSLEMTPGSARPPAPDSSWERMKAVLRAITDRPSSVRRKYSLSPGEGNAEDFDLQGLIFSRQESYREAEESFRRAVAADPSNHLYFADLGVVLFHQEKLAEAKDAFLKSLGLGKGREYSYTHYYLGEIYRREGDFAASHEALREAVATGPPLSEAHYQFALLLVERGDLGEADYYFGKAARLRGNYSAALRSFNRAESRLGADPVWATRIAEELWQMQ